MGLKPRTSARQIGNDRTATARQSLDSHKGKALEKRRQYEHVGRAICLHQIILANFARECDRYRMRQLARDSIATSIAMALRARFYARDAWTLRQQIQRPASGAFDTFLSAIT